MIRAGRQVIDLHGIAELHGLTPANAKRERPWADTRHPKPLSKRNPTSKRPQLWDAEQAEAYADGRPVPRLPQHDDPDDLLDRFEAAELAEVSAEYWKRRHLSGRGPAPDAAPYGVPHWTRRAVLADKAERAKTAGKAGGRPSTLRQRVEELVKQAERDKRPQPTADELAAVLGVHRITVWRHLQALAKDTTTP